MLLIFDWESFYGEYRIEYYFNIAKIRENQAKRGKTLALALIRINMSNHSSDWQQELINTWKRNLFLF